MQLMLSCYQPLFAVKNAPSSREVLQDEHLARTGYGEPL